MNLLNERDVTNAFRKELATRPIGARASLSAGRPALPGTQRPIAAPPAAKTQASANGEAAGRGAAPGQLEDSNRTPVGAGGAAAANRGAGAGPPGACPPPPSRCPPPRPAHPHLPPLRRPPVSARRGAALGGAAPRHVGEHGGAAAPGDDQPVRAGGRLRRRPGQAAAAGGPLAVRDGPERLLPGDQHPQQPPPPPDDVHPQQHAGHAAELPGRPGHVLQAAHLREPAEQQQPHPLHGLLPPRELQPLLGFLAPQPPARLAAPLLAHRPRPPPPPAPPAARLAPRPAARRPPTESHAHRGRPEIRLGWWEGGWGWEYRRGVGGGPGRWERGLPEKRTGIIF